MKAGRSDASFNPGPPGIGRLWLEFGPDTADKKLTADRRQRLLEDIALAAAADDAPPAAGLEPGIHRLWPDTASGGWQPLG